MIQVGDRVIRADFGYLQFTGTVIEDCGIKGYLVQWDNKNIAMQPIPAFRLRVIPDPNNLMKSLVYP